MGMIELILTVCALSQPNLCEDQHLQFQFNGSPNRCAMGAAPHIAKWAEEHPKWTVTRWHCEYPGKRPA